MGQEAPGAVALVGTLVELLKVTVTMIVIALVISFVEKTTASLHFQNRMIAAIAPFQVNMNIFFDREYAIILVFFFAKSLAYSFIFSLFFLSNFLIFSKRIS